MKYVSTYLLWIGVLSTGQLCAQQPEVSISVDVTSLCGVTCSDAVVGNVDLSDYVIYEVYLHPQSEDGCVLSILGADPNVGGLDCVPDDYDLVLEIPCGAFQHPLGTTFLSDNVCDLFDLFPCLQYDSFLTIGNQCELPEYAVNNSIVSCDLDAVYLFNGDGIDPFSGQGFIIDSGSLWAPGGVGVDEQGRVLIARVVSCGDLYFKTSVFYRNPCETGSPETIYSPDLTVFQPQPCDAFPMTNHSNPLCEDPGTITFYEGGFGYTNYSLFSASGNEWINDFLQIDGDLVITDLSPGEYYLSMTDSIGCCAISEVFVIPSADDLLSPPQLMVEVLNSVSCLESFDGAVMVNANSPNGDIGLTYEWNDSTVVIENIGWLGSLGCGEYHFTALDSAGCSVDTLLVISCPEELTMELVSENVSCYGYADGNLVMNYTGVQGFASIQMESSEDVQYFDTSLQEGILEFVDMSADVYNLTITDSAGCSVNTEIEIYQPEPMWCEVYGGNEKLGNDGWVCVDAGGGNGDYVYEWSDGSQDVCIDGVPPGVYTVLVTDAQGCICSGSTEVFADVDERSNEFNSINLWPNPANEVLYFSWIDFPNAKVYYSVCDAMGRVVVQSYGASTNQIHIASLSQGLYVLTLGNGETSSMARFVVVK